MPLNGIFLCTAWLAVAFLAATAASAQNALTAEDRQSLERAISLAAETARSGSRISWHGSGDIGGRITPSSAYSAATGELCDACTDPCRRIDYTVVTSAAFSEYRGARCRDPNHEDGEAAVWSLSGSDRLVRNLPAAPVLPPPSASSEVIAPPKSAPPVDAGILAKASRRDLVSNIQAELSKLLYYRGALDGQFGDATRRALGEFLNDERSRAIAEPNESVLQLLRAANARAIYTTCERPADTASTANMACGVVAQ